MNRISSLAIGAGVAGYAIRRESTPVLRAILPLLFKFGAELRSLGKTGRVRDASERNPNPTVSHNAGQWPFR